MGQTGTPAAGGTLRVSFASRQSQIGAKHKGSPVSVPHPTGGAARPLLCFAAVIINLNLRPGQAMIPSIAAESPIRRMLHQSSLYRIVVTILHFVSHRILSAAIVVIAPSLPNGHSLMSASRHGQFFQQSAARGSQVVQDFFRRLSLHFTDDQAQMKPKRWYDHQVYMLRHNDIGKQLQVMRYPHIGYRRHNDASKTIIG